MTTRPLLAAVFAGCLLLLSACAPAPAEPTAADEPVPQAGQCLAASAETPDGQVIPDHTTITPCTEPHRYAVIEAVPVPASLLSGETAEELLQNRAELLGSGAAATEYNAWAGAECATSLAETVGVSALSIGEIDAETARLSPSGAFTIAHSLTEEPHWAAGIHNLVCTVRWTEPEDASTSRELSLPAGVHLSELYSSEFPIEARQCVIHGEEQAALSGCAVPHLLEPFLTFDAGAVYGADWVEAVDPNEVSFPQYQQLDKTCEGFLDFALGGENGAVTARGELMSSGWFDDSADPHGVYCALAPAESGRYDVEGSLIGIRDAEPQLVPAA